MNSKNDSDPAQRSLPGKPEIDERSGQESLQGHIVDRASAAYVQYGPDWTIQKIDALLQDSKYVRFPVALRFEADQLQSGEFAYMHQNNPDKPSNGFTLYIHPHFRFRIADLPFLIAYHLVIVNYGDIADSNEAELFGATLMGMEQDAYYEKICSLTDELNGI